MLIDWLTAYLPMDQIPSHLWESLRLLTDRVVRYCPRTGETRWESAAWDSVRSDSHQIAFKVGGDAIWLQGSPARVIGSGDAVFGEGPAAALNLRGCLDAMVRFVCSQSAVMLPREPWLWHVCRIDVTGNLLLEDLAAVRVALRHLRECEGGRYRVSQQAGDTVYWSHKSKLRAGKAYAKGPHIEYLEKQKGYTGRAYSVEEKALISRLLRLELKLGSQYLRERIDCKWYQLTPEYLIAEWREYFFRMIGESTMASEDDVKPMIYEAAERLLSQFNKSRKNPIKSSEGIARSAYGCYLTIQNQGWEKARELFSKTTWYRHLRVLHEAGLGDMDIAVGKVVPIRRKILECQLVNSWADLKRVA